MKTTEAAIIEALKAQFLVTLPALNKTNREVLKAIGVIDPDKLDEQGRADRLMLIHIVGQMEEVSVKIENLNKTGSGKLGKANRNWFFNKNTSGH